jgi:hypothetical protein
MTSRDVYVRRHAEGRVCIAAQCEEQYADSVRGALIDAVQIFPAFREDRFRAFLRRRGVPDNVIDACVGTVSITEDEAYLRD